MCTSTCVKIIFYIYMWPHIYLPVSLRCTDLYYTHFYKITWQYFYLHLFLAWYIAKLSSTACLLASSKSEDSDNNPLLFSSWFGWKIGDGDLALDNVWLTCSSTFLLSSSLNVNSFSNKSISSLSFCFFLLSALAFLLFWYFFEALRFSWYN